MLKRGVFKAQDLVKLVCPDLDTVLTHLLCHIVRTEGDKEKLILIRRALSEIEKFISECENESEYRM